MRKKSEEKIRRAAAALGDSNLYRIDRVREKTNVIRKVFDKTILDMARLKTIELKGGDTQGMSASEIGNLICLGDELYVYFTFLDSESEPEKQRSDSDGNGGAEKQIAASQRSRDLFDAGYLCAESVLQSIAEAKGIQSDLIPKIATGFCSGVSRTCHMCGAVSGAIMAISMIFGRNAPDKSVEKNYSRVRTLMAMFEDRFGSINCQELIGCDLGTEEGQHTYQSNNLRAQCKEYTAEATKIAVSLI